MFSLKHLNEVFWSKFEVLNLKNEVVWIIDEVIDVKNGVGDVKFEVGDVIFAVWKLLGELGEGFYFVTQSRETLRSGGKRPFGRFDANIYIWAWQKKKQAQIYGSTI